MLHRYTETGWGCVNVGGKGKTGFGAKRYWLTNLFNCKLRTTLPPYFTERRNESGNNSKTIVSIVKKNH